MTDFQPLLARIADGLARGLIDQRAAAHYFGAWLARRLYCSRVAFWTIADAPGRAVVTRLGGHDALLERPLADAVSLRIDAPSAWLGELLARGSFMSVDAAADRRLIAQREGYLAPQRVGAVLQAVIGTEDRVCGLVSCEHVGGPRLWTHDDAALLHRVADAIARVRDERLALEGA